ncbi:MULTISPECIES: BMC domain-containing protein [Lutispora]|uniref:BMC domain-containing protein n=1 Tax=Lutispora saccharofermentans TaxID=3024236 RepID=A0ABT1NG23_9FIRM|nr:MULTISPECIES: BMC domain-containing protein [Lutispora]MCQ1530188.1 BMC domain-containing protein [Lutispora saccharofermentans]MEA4961240.1 BMC domain-containing protein [Lutispora sp.]HCJ57603.1 hypothetical protein [Clostridiaceae bacterium]
MKEKLDLRTFIIVDNMQPQYAAITGTVAKGDIPLAGMSELYIELAPGSGVYNLLNIALKQTNAKPGFQIVEREYGEIELHSYSPEDIKQAGQAILDACGLDMTDRIKPRVVSEQIISNTDPYQAQLINRDGRLGSILVPGESLFIMEVEPAAYISIAVNEAEKNAQVKVVTFDPVGRFGRMYISGSESEVRAAREAALAAIENVEGRQ